MLVDKKDKQVKIEKAVLPVAGLAKRWGEITEYIPKELIPIVRRDTDNIKPAIQYVIEEVLDSGIREIIFIMDYKKKALVALSVLKKNTFKIVKSDKKGDNAIIDYAKRHNIIVATNDRGLIKTLKSHGTRVIRLRQKKYIIEE